MGLALAGIGLVVGLVGAIWLIVAAFKESLIWGLLVLLVNPAGLIFALTNWEKGGKPFLLNVAGVVMMFAGIALSAPPPPA